MPFDLSNREIAILILVTAFLAIMMRLPNVRNSILSLLRCALSWKLTTGTLLAWLWIALGVWLLSKFGIWTIIHLKETVLWAAFSGTLIAFRGLNADDPIKQFRAVLTEQLKWTSLFVFYANWESFPLFGELLLIPCLAILGGLLGVAESGEKYKIIVAPLQGIASIIGLGLLAYVSLKVFQEPQRFFSFSSLVSLVLPFVLAIWTVPFGYVISLIGVYEMLILHLKIGHDQPRDLRFYSIVKAFELGHVNAAKVRRMDKLMARRAIWAKSHDELDELYKCLRETLLDPDNRESRDFLWPEPELLEGEMRYSSLSEYLEVIDPLLNRARALWHSTVEEFSKTTEQSTIPPKLERFLSTTWHEADELYQYVNTIHRAPKEAELFDRVLHCFCCELHNMFWMFSPENPADETHTRRDFLTFAGYRYAAMEYERMLRLRAKLPVRTGLYENTISPL